MYGEVVLGVVAPNEHDEPPFDAILDDVKREAPREPTIRISTEAALREAVAAFKAEVRDAHRQRVPRRRSHAAVGRDRRGVPVVEQPARRRLPQA